MSSAPVNRLELQPATFSVPGRGVLGRRRTVPVAHYLAITVDGHRLEDLAVHGIGLVSPLQRWWLERSAPVIDELLGQTDHLRLPNGFAPIQYVATGRVPLLVCPWDDDITCGWLTTRVSVGADTVTWDEFRWESGWEADTARVEGLPEQYVFQRDAYQQTLRSVNVEALPEVDPDAEVWQKAEPVPGVPAGWEKVWGAVTRIRAAGRGVQ